MTISTIPAAKQALFDRLAARITDAGVSYGTPPSWQPNRLVWVGEANRDVAPSAMVGSGGTGWLREDYTIDIHIRVSLQATNGAVVDVAAYEILAAVEDAIRDDPSLGGVVAVARPSGSTEDQTAEQQKGRMACHLILAVHCTATI